MRHSGNLVLCVSSGAFGGCGWMFVGEKNFHRIFANASLGFVFVLAAAGVSQAKTKPGAGEPTAAVKRQAASAQFNRAEEQRAALNSKPSEKRSLAEYKQVVLSYRRVALITPRAAEVPDSLLAVAELYTEMGDRFGRSYYQSAADSYQFLVHEYPASKYCQDAILRIARLERDRLGDTALARKTYEDFLKHYPRSPRKREAQEALAELALLQNSEESPAAIKAEADSAIPSPPTNELRANATPHSSAKVARGADSRAIPRLRRIRAAAKGDSARVTIDLEDSVQYISGRIAKPDRIFFDLHAARLTPEMARENIPVEGELLTGVRVAQNHAGVVRVVLDVNGVKDYTASLMNNPPQLVIDLYGTAAPAAPVRTAKTHRGQQKTVGDDSNDGGATASSGNSGDVQPGAPQNAPINQTAALEQPANNSPSAINGTIGGAIGGPSAGNTSASVKSSSLPNAKSVNSKSLKATSASAKPDLIRPVSTPQPTRDGQSTLTRALGLKIGRIVIDPGHGGHDTGTIGATGLMEKDLCLDVALRFGKIIQQRLPGAEVVYTRADDTYIPLEERTNIANQAKADLFISIHANSSQDRGARGIETYYLNLKGSAEAMEVAARENATAQEGVHDLQDLVKKIAQTEKIEESRELAVDIQDSLSKRIQKSAKTVKNRGVRKAPFVVLIGADMPSILTEISFLSNPADEKLLKQPEQRQKVAEGLYQGMISYLQSMNSVTVNLPAKTGVGRPGATVTVEQSRNQN
jgi:N-acetylmuramoyl-L-alanine amidase